MMGHGFGGMIWMWPGMIIGVAVAAAILVTLILVIIRLVRADQRPPWADGGQHPGGPAASGDTSFARKILDERYARGEIDEDEYRKRRDNLS